MALYPNIITTTAGWELVSKANAQGKGILFTSIILGDGDIDMSRTKDITALTAVISPKLTLKVTEKDNKHDGVFTIIGVLDNASLENGFHLKEVGVMARLEGDSGDVLFAYTNGGNYVDYLANKSRPTQQQMKITFKIGNADKVDIVIPNEVYVTKEGLTPVIEGLKSHKQQSTLDHPDYSVTTIKLANYSVTTEKIASQAVTADKLAQGVITSDKLRDSISSGTYAYITYNSKGLVTGGTNTIASKVTFSSGITINTTPSYDYDGVNKKYVDDAISNASSIEVWRF